MDTGRISGRYAKAIYALASGKGEEKRLYEEMKTLVGSFASFRDLRKVLENPTISGEDKTKVLTTAAGIQVSESFKSLLKLLTANKREPYAQSIALMYMQYYRKQKGMVTSQLITAEATSDETKEKLKEIIASGENKQVDFVASLDASLIGGFVLRLDDYQLDASVKTQLVNLKKELMGEKM